MEPRPRSRRSFLAAILTRAAGLWVAVTGGLAALGAGCDDRPGTGRGGKTAPESPLYGAPRRDPPKDVSPPPEPPKYGAAVPGPPQTLYGAPRPLPEAPPQPEPVPVPPAPRPRSDAPSPPKYGAPSPPKYGAPVPRPRRDAKPKTPPEGS